MIGNSQVLIFGGLSLTLVKENFDAAAFGSLGYRRSLIQNHLLSVSQSVTGASLVEGPHFAPKYEFEWQLWLKQEQLLLLSAIAFGQQSSPRSQGSIPIRLHDKRRALLVPTPRTRAKAGTTGITPPTGHEVIWPQFDVLLNLPADFWEFYLRSTQDLYQVKFSGTELDLVPTSGDVA